MTTVRPKEWTYEEFMALPEGGPLRYEIIDGELSMTPAPDIRHQKISGNLFAMIHLFFSRHPLGEVFSAPTDVVLPRSAPGGRTGSDRRLERTSFHHRRKEHRGVSGFAGGDPLRRNGKTGSPREILPLRTLRGLRVLDRRPGVSNRPGLSALRHEIRLPTRIPQKRGSFDSPLPRPVDPPGRRISLLIPEPGGQIALRPPKRGVAMGRSTGPQRADPGCPRPAHGLPCDRPRRRCGHEQRRGLSRISRAVRRKLGQGCLTRRVFGECAIFSGRRPEDPGDPG